MAIHVVRAGDTINGIARQYGITPMQLMLDNALKEEETLVIGQALVVLIPDTVYRVQAGDTLYGIARQFDVPLLQLYQNNWFLQGQPALQAGSTLVIAYQDERIRTISVNAYAPPGIPSRQLTATLPYLTFLSPFTYGITETGRLLPLADCDLLSAAGRFHTAALLHLSTLTEDRRFDNSRSSKILNDIELQEALIEEILETLQRRNFYGVDVDFEFVPPAERELYADFVNRLRQRLNASGYVVIVALAPKTSDEQAGLLYEAHDYSALGNAANAVFLMTYEWGYTYGEPMAVAPIPQVREVLDYAVTRIPSEKILMGIPLYGYDWPLPYQKGQTRARSISPLYAVDLARRYGAAISYDSVAQAPHFDYTAENGQKHTVWFEDARSMEAKLKLVNEYTLAGVGYWNLMRSFPQNWLLLNQLYFIEKVLT